VFGDGSQTRSFCYVLDLIEGIYNLMLSNINEPVNLGNPQELAILEFAKTVLKITGSRSEITFKALPVDDPKIRQLDITKAQELLNWHPKVELEDGIRKTIEYFRANNPKPDLYEAN